ncbi:MAG: T9SS type A sorting domain-containing protein [Saprospiraceae bacterium]|nr:T9SS type A sorting domain-containing protein [Saprospiraceae bacterium]MCF8249520.1 T9SS type A sorting domain-containing protein [Saprospiraceae bacterium]MCF8280145.1 T9SS type A sorting domain-containing protein [Bacteroidales bacterium]MCF8310738.1 T9SS type A sorting domain-containing protein [Saprospiraceae bacterium]MCF8439431.1 T9SS type A sorting domain-containing protein [Saprospiraceae bacterium]
MELSELGNARLGKLQTFQNGGFGDGGTLGTAGAIFNVKCMSRLGLIFLLLLGASNTIYSQDKFDYVWLFGRYEEDTTSIYQFGGSRIDFNFNPPEISYFDIPVDFDFNETSMVCDSTGNLQLYTDGCSIVNYDNLLVENGDSINPGEVYDEWCALGYGYPSTQCSMALPKPGSDHIYYLFHIGIDESLYTRYFQYTVADMSKNNGLGEVLVKNQPIFDTIHFAQQMTAVRHANGRDWWLVLPYGTVDFENGSSNRYFKFLFSPQGITGPIEQDIGDGWGAEYYSGQATFSPDGSKYVRLNPTQGMRIFDFDRCTGELSNPKAIYFPNDTLTSCGVSFSPNSRFLYASLGSKLVQYDTWSTNIEASRVIVAVYDGFMSPLWTRFYQHMLAPNGKIYITVPNSANVLHIIHHPNWQGLACEVEQHGVALPTIHDWNIPNFPHFRLYDVPGSICDSLGINTPTEEAVTQAMQAKLWPNPASEMVNVTLHGTLAKPATFHLFDPLGREVKRTALSAGQQESEVGLAGVPPGMYFWRVESQGKLVGSGKIAVLR